MQYIILFDGYCNLCNGIVDWLIKKDRHKKFIFISLQQPEGINIIKEHAITHDEKFPDTIYLLIEKDFYEKSEAVLQIIQQLPLPYRWLYAFSILPKSLRDKLYDYVSKKRYKWFGKRKTCRIDAGSK